MSVQPESPLFYEFSDDGAVKSAVTAEDDLVDDEDGFDFADDVTDQVPVAVGDYDQLRREFDGVE